MIALQRRQCLRLAMGLGTGLLGTAPTQAANRLQWAERSLIGFGTSLWLRAAHANPLQLDAALDAAVRAIRHVEQQMSLFDANSAVSQLNRQCVLENPDADLLRAVQLSQTISQRSAGAFDITMQPLWNTWATAQAQGLLPSSAQLREACALVGWRGLAVLPQRMQLMRAGMGLSLNGIAQGYAADKAKAQLQAHGIEHALIDTGEWSPMGVSPSGQTWTLALERPSKPLAPSTLPLLVSDGRALATSSDAHTVFSTDHRHHHIIDPRSGYSPLHWASITLAAPSCALADALTKVMFMASPQNILQLARAWQVDVLAVDKKGRWLASPGMPIRCV